MIRRIVHSVEFKKGHLLYNTANDVKEKEPLIVKQQCAKRIKRKDPQCKSRKQTKTRWNGNPASDRSVEPNVVGTRSTASLPQIFAAREQGL